VFLASRLRGCAAQSRCTPPRAITMVRTPSSPSHPHLTNTAIRDTQCGSDWSAVFTFETVEPAKTRVGLTNHVMTHLTFGNMELVGSPRFPTRRATSPARSSPISASRQWKNPFLEDNERLMPPAE
jgi:hypothetical protein